VNVQSGATATINEAFKQLNVSTDFNNAVKDGKFNKAYFTDLNKKLNDTSPSLDALGVDSEYFAMIELFNDFYNKELSKKSVRDKFMKDLNMKKSGGLTTFTGKINLGNMLKTFGEYADQRAKDSKYVAAAKAIHEMINSASMSMSLMGDLEFEVALEKSILENFRVALSLPPALGGTIAIQFKVKDVNATDLSKDKALADLINKAVPSGSSSANLPFGGII